MHRLGNANSSLWIKSVMYKDFTTSPCHRFRNTYQTQYDAHGW